MKTTIMLLLMAFSFAVFSQTVIIGTQEWETKNVNVGDRIPLTQLSLDNGIIEKYCYNNLESNCAIYGGLYQWDEMMQYVTSEGSQGICAEGFRVATKADWDTLVKFVGEEKAGISLRETGSAHWPKAGPKGVDEFGFKALAGGYGYGHKASYLLNNFGYFWTSTLGLYPSCAYFRYFNPYVTNTFEYVAYVSDAKAVMAFAGAKAPVYSVRCIKN